MNAYLSISLPCIGAERVTDTKAAIRKTTNVLKRETYATIQLKVLSTVHTVHCEK